MHSLYTALVRMDFISYLCGMKIPELIQKHHDSRNTGVGVTFIGEYKDSKVYGPNYRKDDTIGLPVLYIFDGSVKEVIGMDAIKLLNSAEMRLHTPD